MLKTILASLIAVSVYTPTVCAGQLGAIQVVDRYGLHLDGNYFNRSDNIYLVGGPAAGTACAAPGLPDGDYFFELTDPSGASSFSSDPIADRRVRVTGGVIAQYLGTTHAAGVGGPCGSILVQMIPFTLSPLANREYKIWFTRVEDYDLGGAGFFGFIPQKSKSESFKLVEGRAPVAQSIIRGRAFYDHDQNGVWNPLTDPLEVPVGGWRVEISRNGIVDGVTFTDQDGWYTFIRDRDSTTRALREKAPGGFVGDGIPGAAWVATTPVTGQVVTNVEQLAGPDFGVVHFEVAAGAGRSVEFWSEHGRAGTSQAEQILGAIDPLWRDALNMHNGAPVNLRTPVSNDNPPVSIFRLRMPPQSFDGAFANWKSYTERTSHDHAGFLLSRQVGAALLNNQFGFMQGSILVDRHQDGILVPLETLLTGAIGLLSEVGAGLTGPNDPFQDLRMMMLMCLNEFSSINNTGDLAAPQVVYTRSLAPIFFDTPYEF